MAPFYADDDIVARTLVKIAAETYIASYLATDAVEGSSFELMAEAAVTMLQG